MLTISNTILIMLVQLVKIKKCFKNDLILIGDLQLALNLSNIIIDLHY